MIKVDSDLRTNYVIDNLVHALGVPRIGWI